MRHTQRVLSIVLIVALAGLLVWVSEKYDYNADWTAGNRNSLTTSSERLLDAMPDKITFTAFAYPGPGRKDIRVQVDRYQRYRPSIELKFIDPAKNPQKVRKLNIRHDGEMRVTYQGRKQTIDGALTEQSITNALQRLSVAGQQWIVFLTGHGERDAQDEDEPGYSILRKELDRQGLKVRGLNLAESPRVPDNTSVLVIASPQTSLLPGEVQLLRDYVTRGGNLLWLDDPGSRQGLTPLADDLGIKWLKGTAIYPDYKELGTGHPAIALIVSYPRHAITEHLNSLTLFPFAGGLAAKKDSDWRATAILKTPPRSWLETGSLDSSAVTFNEKDGDQVGPIDIGFALQRPAPHNKPETDAASDKASPKDTDQAKPAPQRAVVIADSDFLANSQINQLGNLKLGLSLFQWLTNRDSQIAVNVPAAPDSSLQLAPWEGRFIWYGYVLCLPLLLLGLGVGRWWWRQRR